MGKPNVKQQIAELEDKLEELKQAIEEPLSYQKELDEYLRVGCMTLIRAECNLVEMRYGHNYELRIGSAGNILIKILEASHGVTIMGHELQPLHALTQAVKRSHGC